MFFLCVFNNFLFNLIIVYLQAAAAFFAGAMLVAPAAFAKDLENGETVFNANCAACHAGKSFFSMINYCSWSTYFTLTLPTLPLFMF